MLKFTNINQKNPDKSPSDLRAKNFSEIYSKFDNKMAGEQSSRCSQCGVPFCQVHCPLQNNIPDWLMLTAENRIEEAYEMSSATNNMPEICGRICPQDKLCEGNCVIETSGHGSVTIGSIEKYITDVAWQKGWVKDIKVKEEKKTSVGIIGSGPAGLAAGEQLRKKGYQVSIYERNDRLGGLLIYGIPNFKLEKEIVNRRIHRLKKSGINFYTNYEIGNTISFEEFKNKHDAVLIATGVYKPKEINLNNSQASNVVAALDFLIASNRKGLGDNVKEFDNGNLNSKGKNIIVVGGGDTAMDCVRTAIRQGAKSVKCLYRRDRKNMPGSQREVKNAIEEGIEFKWMTLPIDYIGDKKINEAKIIKMQLGLPDESGRKKPEPIEGSEENHKVDLIIEALGFEPENLQSLFNQKDLKITKWGTVKINYQSMMTNIEGVFAAGDIVRGASLVVWGIKDGRDVAKKIEDFLVNKEKNIDKSKYQKKDLAYA